MAPTSLLARSPGSKFSGDCSHGGIRFKNFKVQHRNGRVTVKFQWTWCDSSPEYFAFVILREPGSRPAFIDPKVLTRDRGKKYLELPIDTSNTRAYLELVNIDDYEDVYDRVALKRFVVKPDRA
ncbi:hypothetical protein FRC04_006813 [Tulasnella sp. 424]|nr:hypothetical protein FRC04_006813 [Tulasnella sp. 424]KAG8972642.1 hypothetical protein FRC05_009752 [Tulasnella sp. 425]